MIGRITTVREVIEDGEEITNLYRDWDPNRVNVETRNRKIIKVVDYN